MSKFITLFIAVSLFISSLANADFNLKLYKEISTKKQFKDDIESYVTGVGRGIAWTNIAYKTTKNVSLICLPEKLAWDQGIIMSVLDQEIRTGNYTDESSIEMILVKGFMKRFPCPE